MKKLSMILFCYLFAVSSNMVSAKEMEPVVLDEIHVTATRTEKDMMDIPAAVYSISSQELNNSKIVRTLPDALKEVNGVMVQKTSHGQGSPYMRGLTGFRNLFLIDGIRLNNSIFREGPNQYWNTVDPFSLEKMEIVKGPGSVLYGSDSIGGTVNVFTRTSVNVQKGSEFDGRFYGRYSNGEDSYVGRIELGGNSEKFGWIIGLSLKDFGDIEGGEEVGNQPCTGYDEWDGDLKFEYNISDESKLVFAHQNVDQDDAWRTHRTIYGVRWRGTGIGTDKIHLLDQARNLTYLQYYVRNHGSFIDSLKLSLSYHEQKESTYRVRSDNRSDIQAFDVGTVGFWAQVDDHNRYGTWTYGVEYYHDYVESSTVKYNADGSLNSVEIQGPVADDAAYDLFGIFVQDDVQVTDSFSLLTGGRYTYAGMDAEKVKDPVTGMRTSLKDDWNSIVGSIRLLYRIDKNNHFIFFGGISQGFRAPNLSDVTRLDTARSNEIETAAIGLKPEKFITSEAGLKSSYNGFSSQIVYYYTDIEEMIVRSPTGNTIDGSYEVTKKNSGDGYINGIEFNIDWHFLRDMSAYGSFAWTYGEVDTFPTSTPVMSREPVDRIMPVTYMAGIKWASMNKYWFETFMVRSENQDKLSTSDKHDTQRIPPDGTPGYTVFNIRSGWKIDDTLTISAVLENIFDKDYRIHGSGSNEAGRNLVISMEYYF